MHYLRTTNRIICLIAALIPLIASAGRGEVPVSHGDTLRYTDIGQGTPVIFIHGHSLDSRMWHTQMQVLSRYCRTIAVDCRGYGRSSLPREHCPFTHAADIVTLMDSLHLPQAHFVGLSMGGFITADIIAMYPHRVISAILASGNLRKSKGPSQPLTFAEVIQKRREALRIRHTGVDAMKSQWTRSLLSSAGSQRMSLQRELAPMIADWKAWQPLHLEPRVIVGLDARKRLMDTPPQWRPQMPVLIVEGASQTNRRNLSPEIMQYLADAKAVEIPDCGHMLSMERPFAFNLLLLRFLKPYLDFTQP